MNIKQLNIQLGQEAIQISNNRQYFIGGSCISLPPPGPVACYTENELQDLKPNIIKTPPKISVVQSCSVDAAIRAYDYPNNRRVAVLNFANAVSPGGGFLRGCQAQEEKICRCSDLYQSLVQKQQEFYDYHKSIQNFLTQDRIIISHNFIFKDSSYNPLPQPVEVCMVTCAAVKTSLLNIIQKSGLSQSMERKITNIMKVISGLKVDCAILGAFGCGAFGNDPKFVSNCFKKCIMQCGCCPSEVVFAIYGEGENVDAFRGAFGE